MLRYQLDDHLTVTVGGELVHRPVFPRTALVPIPDASGRGEAPACRVPEVDAQLQQAES
ncbi:MAG: hypothetical protein WBM50_13395 [Acidimicrobiales bacterium]